MGHEPIFFMIHVLIKLISVSLSQMDAAAGHFRTVAGQCPISMTSWGWRDDAERGFKGDA